MVESGRILIVLGILLVIAGAFLSATGRVWRLPGDILIRRDGLVIYLPIVTSVLLSVLLTLGLSVLFRRR